MKDGIPQLPDASRSGKQRDASQVGFLVRGLCVCPSGFRLSIAIVKEYSGRLQEVPLLAYSAHFRAHGSTASPVANTQ